VDDDDVLPLTPNLVPNAGPAGGSLQLNTTGSLLESAEAALIKRHQLPQRQVLKIPVFCIFFTIQSQSRLKKHDLLKSKPNRTHCL
jgi:hypothetical protein